MWEQRGNAPDCAPTLDEQGADGFVAVSTGLDHACALDGSGVAYCWGSNSSQQTGASLGHQLRHDHTHPLLTLGRAGE